MRGNHWQPSMGRAGSIFPAPERQIVSPGGWTTRARWPIRRSFDNGSPTSPAIAITSLGRVGIGTTNPQTALHVIGSEGGFPSGTHPHCQ